jgi:hypothetical protein
MTTTRTARSSERAAPNPLAANYYDTRSSSSREVADGEVKAWDVRRMVYEATGAEPSDKTRMIAYRPYSPVKSVEVRLGYHVSPVYYNDTPMEGRGNGRKVWRDAYMWEHGVSVFDAERALTDVKMVSLMGVISF